MATEKLSDEQIKKELSNLPGWNVTNGKLHKDFIFKDFIEAFGFISKAAVHIEKMNHHPEWSNVWNKVVFDLTTHSVKGISDLDFVLAEKIEEIFATHTASRATSGT